MGTLASPSSFHTRRGGSGAERSGDACVALPFIPMGTLASPSPFHTRRGGSGWDVEWGRLRRPRLHPPSPPLSKNTGCLMLLLYYCVTLEAASSPIKLLNCNACSSCN